MSPPSACPHAIAAAEWAWLAGLFEGEGTIALKGKNQVTVGIKMTDLDVMETVQSISPARSGLKMRASPNPAWKTQYHWRLMAQDDVRAFLTGVRPWLHNRRGQKADEALVRVADARPDPPQLPAVPRRVSSAFLGADPQWAWMAGLFEAEGTLQFQRRTCGVQVSISMADWDVLETVNRLYPSPARLRLVPVAQPHHKPQKRWSVGATADMQTFLTRIRPYLHGRRGARVDEALRRIVLLHSRTLPIRHGDQQTTLF